MASLWKVLANLMLPRRQQRQERGAADDVKPDVSAITKVTETATDHRADTADPPVNKTPDLHDQLEAVSPAPHSEETTSGLHGTADIDSASPVGAADPALSNDAGTAVYDAPKPSQTGEGAAPKRSNRAKKAATGEAVEQSSQGVATVSDNGTRLDEEIRLLRNQLARKLQLQNAQLKKMLERFKP